MNYQLAENHRELRKAFCEKFLLSYADFTATHAEWISLLREEFNEEYYGRMFMWDKFIPSAKIIRFADALSLLRSIPGEVFFITETADVPVREFCKLNNRMEFAAIASASELAKCISYEWFTDHELFEQGRYLADPLLPSEVYVFDGSMSWCIVFTHETDETEAADSRVCLYTDLR